MWLLTRGVCIIRSVRPLLMLLVSVPIVLIIAVLDVQLVCIIGMFHKMFQIVADHLVSVQMIITNLAIVASSTSLSRPICLPSVLTSEGGGVKWAVAVERNVGFSKEHLPVILNDDVLETVIANEVRGSDEGNVEPVVNTGETRNDNGDKQEEEEVVEGR